MNVQKSIEVTERRIECEEAGQEIRAGLAQWCETKLVVQLPEVGSRAERSTSGT